MWRFCASVCVCGSGCVPSRLAGLCRHWTGLHGYCRHWQLGAWRSCLGLFKPSAEGKCRLLDPSPQTRGFAHVKGPHASSLSTVPIFPIFSYIFVRLL